MNSECAGERGEQLSDDRGARFERAGAADLEPERRARHRRVGKRRTAEE
jgi:hypothetical protein